jgi:hypothetical protein
MLRDNEGTEEFGRFIRQNVTVACIIARKRLEYFVCILFIGNVHKLKIRKLVNLGAEDFHGFCQHQVRPKQIFLVFEVGNFDYEVTSSFYKHRVSAYPPQRCPLTELGLLFVPAPIIVGEHFGQELSIESEDKCCICWVKHFA